MIVVYIADDGTEFETEQECLECETPLDGYKVSEVRELWINNNDTSL